METETVETDIQEIWEALEEVKDPELPFVSVVEMGMVRGVEAEGKRVTVGFTPTFSGCPALQVIRRDIETKLRERGLEPTVNTLLSPPWSSDWITEAGREKLRNIGVAPPAPVGNLVQLEPAPLPCPHCGSLNTRVTNAFGPTLCKSIRVCDDCGEPFEGFKSV
jgi:ring-1,2-phenylacetyl-CoA epoxidase subunit PaaD